MKHKTPEEDIQLIASCIKHDLDAWASFVNKFSRLIRFSIERRASGYGASIRREDIEELIQNILASIWQERKLETLKNPESLRYWLAVISGNAAVEFLRKSRSGDAEIKETLPSPEAGPDERLAGKELSQQIDDALRHLSDREKIIINLNIFHDKEYHEIAEILGLPTGTVSSCIKRVKDKLRKELKNFEHF